MSSELPCVLQVHCEDPWFGLIRSGIKTVEGRKKTHMYRKLAAGNHIQFSNGKESFMAIVTEVRRYATIEHYLEDVTLEKALPGVTSMEEGLNIYYQWVTAEQEKQYGFMGIFINPVSAET